MMQGIEQLLKILRRSSLVVQFGSRKRENMRVVTLKASEPVTKIIIAKS